ncbi:eukaryotic translation initiation factor 4 gamma 2 [Pelomyxa schiedti]|nr:eukaryotic translation initiation factor 4 gamma 2 [Pelomyxa schiedti]
MSGFSYNLQAEEFRPRPSPSPKSLADCVDAVFHPKVSQVPAQLVPFEKCLTAEFQPKTSPPIIENVSMKVGDQTTPVQPTVAEGAVPSQAQRSSPAVSPSIDVPKENTPSQSQPPVTPTALSPPLTQTKTEPSTTLPPTTPAPVQSTPPITPAVTCDSVSKTSIEQPTKETPQAPPATQKSQARSKKPQKAKQPTPVTPPLPVADTSLPTSNVSTAEHVIPVEPVVPPVTPTQSTITLPPEPSTITPEPQVTLPSSAISEVTQTASPSASPPTSPEKHPETKVLTEPPKPAEKPVEKKEKVTPKPVEAAPETICLRPRAGKVAPVRKPASEGTTDTKPKASAQVTEPIRKTTQTLTTGNNSLQPTTVAGTAPEQSSPSQETLSDPKDSSSKVYTKEFLMSFSKYHDTPENLADAECRFYKPKPLESTEKGWKRPKNLTPEQKVMSKVMSSLNKLSEENFALISEEIVSQPLATSTLLEEVVTQIFNKAIKEPKWSEMYARLCVRLNQRLVLPASVVDPTRTTVIPPAELSELSAKLFKRILLSHCQRTFQENKWKANRRQPAKENMTPAEQEDQALTEQKDRDQFMGNITFIGELFKAKMVTAKIMFYILTSLVPDPPADGSTTPPPGAEDLEAMCKMLKCVGKYLDVPAGKQFLDSFFEKIKKQAQLPHESRIHFTLLDIIDLREAKWIPVSATVKSGVQKPVVPAPPPPVPASPSKPRAPATLKPTSDWQTMPEKGKKSAASPARAKGEPKLGKAMDTSNVYATLTEVTGDRPAKKSQPQKTAARATTPPVASVAAKSTPKSTSPTRSPVSINEVLETFCSSGEITEAVEGINGLGKKPNVVCQAIEWLLLDGPKDAPKRILELLSHLKDDNSLTEKHFCSGVALLLKEKLDDIIPDVPLFAGPLSFILAGAVKIKLLSFAQLPELLAPLIPQTVPSLKNEDQYGLALYLLREVFKALTEKSEADPLSYGLAKVQYKLKKHKVKLLSMAKTTIDQNALYLYFEEKGIALSPERQAKVKLLEFLAEPNPAPAIAQWLYETPERQKDAEFSVMVFSTILDQVQSPDGIPQQLVSHVEALSALLNNNPTLNNNATQMACLDEIVKLCTVKKVPKDAVEEIFSCLLLKNIIRPEAFYAWKSAPEPSEEKKCYISDSDFWSTLRTMSDA